jgi:transcriptional regulator with XRE-family HTH domain
LWIGFLSTQRFVVTTIPEDNEGAAMHPEFPQVGESIRRLRQQAGLTQGELAQRADISLDAVNRIESSRRQPNLGTLFQIAQALGVTAVQLLGETCPAPGWSPQVSRLAHFLERQRPEVVAAVEKCAKAVAEVANTGPPATD